MSSEKVFFPNLNGLRFMAAAIVIVGHIEQYKEWLGLPFRTGYTPVEAKLGVILFFVLSGFLITYLLLVERERTGTISIRDFYLRRVLRIWPLYFLIVILTLFILPHLSFFNLPSLDSTGIFSALPTVALLSFLILPNVVLTSFGSVPYGAQMWSIGSEEQFYLIWPVLMKFIRNKWLLIVGVFVFYHALRLGLGKMNLTGVAKGFRGFWNTFHVDCMAIGSGFALLHFQGKNVLNKLASHWLVLPAVCGVLAIVLYKKMWFGFFHYQVFALLFGFIIFQLATVSRRFQPLEFFPLNYLGKISYGLYMYHPIAIVVAIKIFQPAGILSSYVLYPAAFFFTVVLASFSYHFFEQRFIKMKARHTKVASG